MEYLPLNAFIAGNPIS